MSDREIVIGSSFLEPKLFAKDDVVMADRGFIIEDLLKSCEECVYQTLFLGAVILIGMN